MAGVRFGGQWGRRAIPRRVSIGVLGLCLMGISAYAQDKTQNITQDKAQDKAQDKPSTGDNQTADKQAEPETRMTPEQAKDLFKRVDTILAFASKDSGLPIEHGVKRKLVSRAEVNKILRQKFDEDESTKFGLLDRDFQLQPFLIKLLTEQIAGFYDDKTKTVNLLDWIAPDEQEPVLAHELTHALQDQKVTLEKWSDVEAKGIAKNVKEDNLHLDTDEGDTAREAVTEGQAMVVFLDYSMRSTGKTLADAPEMGEKLKELTNDTEGSPVLSRAPLLLQESLLFPYSEGLAFEQAVLVKGGKDAAFAGTLAHPPASSFEIMNPKAYLAHTPVPVLRLPDIHPLIDADYTPYDVGVMGELDVRIVTELFGGQAIAKALTPAWKGGIYYAAQRKSATAAEKETTASLGLFYYSKWENEDSASSFLHVYEAQLPRKYSHVVRRNAEEADENERVYGTNEGDVLLSISGDGAFVAEGFPLALARKLRDSVVSVQPDGPVKIANAWPSKPMPQAGGLALSWSRWISGFGVLKAAEPYTLVRH